jgi:hypothetical protein
MYIYIYCNIDVTCTVYLNDYLTVSEPCLKTQVAPAMLKVFNPAPVKDTVVILSPQRSSKEGVTRETLKHPKTSKKKKKKVHLSIKLFQIK